MIEDGIVGVIHHIVDAHAYENEYFFCRFITDEDHGRQTRAPDGSSVSWTDFISPVLSSRDQKLSLPAKVPGSDPELSSFAQVDLDSCGVEPLDEHNTKLLDLVHPRQ